MNDHDIRSPFQITSPEDLTAEETAELFVDTFTDYPQINAIGHTLIMGSRGVGKSMMFRYLQSDCQCIVRGCKFSELPYLGIYLPVKREGYNKSEFRRLEDRHASEIFNEHLMISNMSARIFLSLLNNRFAIDSIALDGLLRFCKETLVRLLYPYSLGFDLPSDEADGKSSSCAEVMRTIMQAMECAYKEAAHYAKRLAFTTELPTYEGPLFDFQGFLVPLLSDLVRAEGFPDCAVYLLIDDAHSLSETQTRILNTWIATRVSKKISLKVSSEYSYKCYYTVTGATIDIPHDYTWVDLASIYTGKSSTEKGRYRKRIKSIVERRLQLESIDVSAEDYFPFDVKQEDAILKIAEEYKKRFDAGEGRGYRKADDAYRYARADYIKSLSGVSKSSSKYSYSGFGQLVHLSSGTVRHFLEPAHVMYAKEKSNKIDDENADAILEISPSVQSDVSRDMANSFLYNDLEKLEYEGHDDASPKSDIKRLSNLIQGLGGLFRQILLSDGRSERRVFSFAVSDEMSDDVKRIVDIGVNLGFFHRSTIGRKDSRSSGRTRLYILSRRLAPIWNLDPTGFAGYLFVQNSLLVEAMYKPISMLRRIDRGENFTSDEDVHQLSLFDSSDEYSPLEVNNEFQEGDDISD